ncbi:UNVERIFIED_CONTAM: Peroxisomal NADH pyrophosphatase nudt12 [Siphonaria sp. JEL0065]|nr:Peroxisomal NADH pyrophosphatase nudt12 [Siphonaria sp. JEL0065]
MISKFDAAVEAIRAQDLRELSALLDADATLSAQKNEQNWTLLHFAARFNFAPAFELLRKTSDVLAITNDGKTPTELARNWGLAVKEIFASSSTSKVNLSHLTTTERTMFYGASSIDRVGALRKDPAALARILYADNARITFLDSLNFLRDKTTNKLFWLHPNAVDAVQSHSASQFLMSCLTAQSDFALLLLGIDDQNAPLWALDISFLPALKQHVKESLGLEFLAARPKSYELDPLDAAYLAQARSLLDWHARFKFCSLCGHKTSAAEGGYKRVCSDKDCVSHTSIQNSSFPRTDPVAIVCVISSDGEKVLLGRQKAWPAGMYSCIAGFMEPGESMEAAARREAREETGVIVGRVQYYASQPWPFPANLMLGMYGEAVQGGEEIDLVDQELDDAKWFTRREILDAIWIGKGAVSDNTTPAPSLKMSQTYAIAHQLLKNWAENGPFAWTVSNTSAIKPFTYDDYILSKAKY